MTLGLQLVNPVGMAFERGEKKFLNAKTSPLSSLLYFGAGVARLGELRGPLTMSPPFSWVSVLPNLNLLKLEFRRRLIIYYYFLLKQIVKENCEDKGYGAALQRRSLPA